MTEPMDNNPGDSSSESDISDPWSLVDRDSCDETAGVNSVVGSVCGELSDGESLEVIDEESHHDCECKYDYIRYMSLEL
jgi:hypothetical protein